MRVRVRVLPLIFVAASIGGHALADPLTLQQTITNPTPANDLFGQSISLSGGRALVGAQLDDTGGTDTGRAYLFNPATGALLQTFANPNPGGLPTSVPSDAFGLRVSLSGNLALIGAQTDESGTTFQNSGTAYLFDATTGALLRTFANPTPAASDNFGRAVAVHGNLALISATGDDVGASNAGVAHLFNTATGNFVRTFTNPTPASGDNFGFEVALFGNRALISTINDDTAVLNAGAAYLFDTTTGALVHTFLNPTPQPVGNPAAPSFGNNDNFGFSVALSATRALIGAPNENDNGFHNGAAYLYDLVTGNLLDTLLIPTPNSDTEEFLGQSVALSEDWALVGAPFRNKDRSFIGQPLNTFKDLGAAFLFDANTGAFLQEIGDVQPLAGDGFGFAVALDGHDALIGAQSDRIPAVSTGVVTGQVFYYTTLLVAAPEPGTVALLVTGLLGLGLARRRSATSRP
jgi:hypothetical protein